jgi:hypothetical protein
MPIESQNPLKTSSEVTYGADWPVSIYERPLYAMSNLLMRGDVDAATRSIFQPDTLSPSEMQTITNRIAGPNPNPLMKTILDVATNPLVIMGLIGGYLLYPAVGKDVLAKVFLNMRKGVPETGLVGRFVGGSFTRMRHLVTHTGESMHAAIADMNGSILKYVTKDQELRAAAHGSITSVRGQRQIAMELQGYASRGDEGMVKIFKMANTPVSPGLQGKMLDGVQAGADRTKAYLKAVWNELDDIPGFRANHEEAAKKAGLTLGKYRENYYPHIVEQNKLRQGVIKRAGQTAKNAEETWRDPVANSLLRNKGVAVVKSSELREMEAVGDIVAGYADDAERAIQANISEFRGKLAIELNKNGYTRKGIEKSVKSVTKRMDLDKVYVEAAVDDISTAAQGIPGGKTLDQALDWASEMIRRPGEYSLNLDDTLTRYSTSMARAKAVFGVPVGQVEAHGDKINRLTEYFRHTVKPGAKDGTTIMPKGGPVDTYVTQQVMPMNLGQMTPKAMARNSAWMEFRKKKIDWLESPMAKKALPDQPRKWMIGKLGDFSSMDADTVGHGINSYLYMSAMGANMGPVSKNVFQNMLTFNNLPGMGGAIIKGSKETLDRSMGYIGDVMNGVKPKVAFERHFKEFIEAQGPQSGLIEKLFGGQEIVGMPATGAKKGVEIARDVLMAPFKFSELFVNRIPSFYGARARALDWGETAVNANRIASNIVDASHFTGGPMGMPGKLIDTWAPWRQFMQFPLRTMDFVLNSTRMGANPTKLNFSTVAKMTAAAAGTYSVGKNMLGMDLGAGLMAGAMPFPQYENSPFYPFPLVPPLVQMAGNVVKGVMQGDPKPIMDVAPLLVPGGTAAVRLQKTLGKKRADYSNRLEDGRVPVYNDRGGLVGAYTPLQLSLRAMGMMPIDVSAERGASKWLITQRDQIRAYRQQWLEAKTANDPVKADKIQRDFKKQYPELGEMQFKKSDINSIEQRRNTARLSRIMRGMPKAYKPLFMNIMQEAQLSDFTQGAPATPLPMELEALR